MMALVSFTSVAAKRAAVCTLLFDVTASSASMRSFASKPENKKKGKKKGNDDANFEQMLRAIKGQYPDAYVLC